MTCKSYWTAIFHDLMDIRFSTARLFACTRYRACLPRSGLAASCCSCQQSAKNDVFLIPGFG